MESKLRLLVAGAVWTLALGCGDTGQSEASATESDTGTESTPSTPTGGETEPTGGATGDTSDPELAALCVESRADGKKISEAQCGCLVEQGIYPDVATCLADGQSASTDECICAVYSGFPAVKVGLECVRPAQTTALACLTGVSCVAQPADYQACFDAYTETLAGCEKPGQDAAAKVAIDCAMESPFTCGSGELVPESWTCNFTADCADQTDETSCPNSFACVNGQGFVPLGYQCDGMPDCSDASDEEGCAQFMCADGTMVPEKLTCDAEFDCPDRSDESAAAGCEVYVCTNGAELPVTFKCDGYSDCCPGMRECPDTSDEDGCPTFTCDSGEEVPMAFKCDGYPDCMDISDEAGCPTFMCGSGEEIPLAFKCDGVSQCMDSSDEVSCP